MGIHPPGPAEPEDRVDDAEVLYRAVRQGEFHRVSDTEVTLSENAFSDRSKQPSVDRAEINDREPSMSECAVTIRPDTKIVRPSMPLRVNHWNNN